MPGILDPIILRGKTVRNRIVMPPIVCFGWSSEDGYPSEMLLEHYRRRAASGIGLVVVEATCVLPEGRLAVPQLGLWNDRQTEGLRKIADVLHAGGAVALVQLHHAGRVAAAAAGSDPIGPSEWSADPEGARRHSVRRFTGHARAANILELENIREAFICAAIRAADAGFDGVELHAAHGYLLSQMASPLANQRTDRYGGSLENRVRLATEIIQGIRDSVRPDHPDFILSARMGGYEPDYESGQAIACAYELAGLDLLHISSGIAGGSGAPPAPPEGYVYNSVVYGAVLVKQKVTIPVIAVNDIRTLARGDELIRRGDADMAAFCRPLLADPDWAAKSIAGLEPESCRHCRNGCLWFGQADACPGRSGVR